MFISENNKKNERSVMHKNKMSIVKVNEVLQYRGNLRAKILLRLISPTVFLSSFYQANLVQNKVLSKRNDVCEHHIDDNIQIQEEVVQLFTTFGAYNGFFSYFGLVYLN